MSMIRRAAAIAGILVLLALALVLVREVWMHAMRGQGASSRTDTVELACENFSRRLS